jgi:hypothetical protein
LGQCGIDLMQTFRSQCGIYNGNCGATAHQEARRGWRDDAHGSWLLTVLLLFESRGLVRSWEFLLEFKNSVEYIFTKAYSVTSVAG